MRYEIAAIIATDACPNPDCVQPRILADGQWWHHTGRYPTECAPRRHSARAKALAEAGRAHDAQY